MARPTVRWSRWPTARRRQRGRRQSRWRLRPPAGDDESGGPGTRWACHWLLSGRRRSGLVLTAERDWGVARSGNGSPLAAPAPTSEGWSAHRHQDGVAVAPPDLARLAEADR